MSEPDGTPERWRQSVRDMIVFCEQLLDHTTGIDESTLVTTRLIYDAALWNIVLLGEAASNIPNAIRDVHPEIPWSVIVGARNQIVHRYWRIEPDTVWDIIHNDVPDLLPRLRRMLNSVR